MIDLFRKWFANAPFPESESSHSTPPVAPKPLEDTEKLYEESCPSFCFRPGLNLMDHLRAEGLTELIAWFHPSTQEPEPKSFISLVVNGMRTGHKIWEKQGISMFHDGSWDRGGGPSRGFAQTHKGVLSREAGG